VARRGHRTSARRRKRQARRIKALGPPLPPAVLSDADWQKILDAIAPLRLKRPVQARCRLARCLRDYRGLRREPATLHNMLQRWQHIDELARELDAALSDEWRHKRWRYNPLIDDALKKYLLPATKSITEHLATSVRIRKGKLDPARDFLYEILLLTVWPRYFGGTLTASHTRTGGPCVRFLRAACALAPCKVPSVIHAGRIVRAFGRGKSFGIVRLAKAVTNQSPEIPG